MKSLTKILFLLGCIYLTVVVSQQCVFAQSEPADSYTFSSLYAQLWCPFGSSCNVYDFAWSAVNTNSGAIYVHSTLSDSGFTFMHRGTHNGTPDQPLCGPSNNWDNGGASLLSAFSTANATQSAMAWNVLNEAVLDDGNPFSGSLTVECNGGCTSQFWVYSPSTFTVTATGGSSDRCTAYHAAWQNASWTGAWYWDGTDSVDISPYANNWHNDNFWPLGWNTAFSVYNGTGHTVTYTAHYYSLINGGVPTKWDSSCSTSNLNYTRTLQLTSGNTWSGNLSGTSSTYDIFDPGSDRTSEDGFMFVSMDNVYPGTTPSSTISGIGSTQNSYCSGSVCRVVTSCY